MCKSSHNRHGFGLYNRTWKQGSHNNETPEKSVTLPQDEQPNEPRRPTDSQNPAPGSESAEQHFGDLRKGAYLKRRAAYQLQASGGSRQAGTLDLPDTKRQMLPPG